MESYDFHKFGNPSYMITPPGPFRETIRFFLQRHFHPVVVGGMPIRWTMLSLERTGGGVPLFVLECMGKASTSCERCQSYDWSHQFRLPSDRTYHFIIPANWPKETQEPYDEWLLYVQTHLLHGIIHSNGLGHLVSINGIEGGSNWICGREIMNLWDRICSSLNARKITVEDDSKKRLIDLRLLHGVAYGRPWFGGWGYKVCNGRFGQTEHTYNSAVESLGSLELNNLTQTHDSTGRGFKTLMSHYEGCFTLRDIVRKMLEVKNDMLVVKMVEMKDGMWVVMENNRIPKRPTVVECLHKCMLDKSVRVNEDLKFVMQNAFIHPEVQQAVERVLATRRFIKEWTKEEDVGGDIGGSVKVVNCTCGLSGYEGELLKMCSHCSQWLHPRCCGIPEDDIEQIGILCLECSGEAVIRTHTAQWGVPFVGNMPGALGLEDLGDLD